MKFCTLIISSLEAMSCTPYFQVIFLKPSPHCHDNAKQSDAPWYFLHTLGKCTLITEQCSNGIGGAAVRFCSTIY